MTNLVSWAIEGYLAVGNRKMISKVFSPFLLDYGSELMTGSSAAPSKGHSFQAVVKKQYCGITRVYFVYHCTVKDDDI